MSKQNYTYEERIPLSLQAKVKDLVKTPPNAKRGKSTGEALHILGKKDHVLAKQWLNTKKNLATFRKGARTTAKKAIEEKYAPGGPGFHAANANFEKHVALQNATKSGGRKRKSKKVKSKKVKSRKHITRKHITRKSGG